jgi:hypothetical protein
MLQIFFKLFRINLNKVWIYKNITYFCVIIYN